MAWQDQLREALPRWEIPVFLAELQALVAALREGRAWKPLLTPLLREHADLALDYLTPGPARDAVAAELKG